MDTQPTSWALGRAATSPFATPRGFAGRLAGWFMLRSNPQHEVLTVLDVRSEQRVLEVGYGPGGLIKVLHERTDASVIHGVDPSPVMRDVATRTNRAAARSGRITLDLGTAERTGLADQSVDHVVSVNSVAIWPDLDAGLRELHRVVRQGGTVVLAWHGGTAPSRIGERLRLPEEKLDRIEAGLAALFRDVTRHQLKRLDVFKATR